MTDDLTKRSLPIDHLALRGDRDAVALWLKDGPVTHGGYDADVGRIAAWLQAQCPTAGSRIASWIGKTRLACVLPLAAVRAGLIHVPVNPLLKRAQVAHILADSGASMLVANDGRAATLDPGDVPPGCVLVRDVDCEAGGTGAALPPLPPSPRSAGEVAAILYTSGSTGRPKGVTLTSANLWLGADSVAGYLGLDGGDRLLGALPLAFDYGQNQLFGALYAGASYAPLDYLTARDVVRAVERFGLTTIAGVPPLWLQLVAAQWPEAAAGSVTRLTNSGGALTRSLIARLQDSFPRARLFAMYGLTEAFRSTFLDPALITSRPESIGKAIPHAEVLIVRPDGLVTDDDEPGELVHCGPLVAQGYWRDPARTAERFRPAPPASRYGGMAVWSGDTARRDADGYLTFVGREDAMIKTSGNRVSPGEIEEAVDATGLAAEAVAFGVPDPALGAAIALVVGAAGDPAAVGAAVSQALRTALPTFMQPRHLIVQPQLPRNANGKLDRSAIVAAATAAIAGDQA